MDLTGSSGTCSDRWFFRVLQSSEWLCRETRDLEALACLRRPWHGGVVAGVGGERVLHGAAHAVKHKAGQYAPTVCTIYTITVIDDARMHFLGVVIVFVYAYCASSVLVWH
ncbi:hypothetical protein AOLI_G00190590 [Acnodon oligacanthus]